MDPRAQRRAAFGRLHRVTNKQANIVIARLLRWLEWPIQIFLWIALLAGFLMMLHVSADVTGRFFFARPLDGTTEIVAAYYMVIVAYLPWAYLAQERQSHPRRHLHAADAAHGRAIWLDIVVKILVDRLSRPVRVADRLAGDQPDPHP